MSYSHLYWESTEEVMEHLQWVVGKDPDDLDGDDTHLVFHLATRIGAPYELVQRLVEKLPDVVSEGTMYMGQTALHTAGKRTRVSVVRLLLRHDPDLLRERNSCGWTFLHTSVKNGLDLKIIKLIVRRWKGSVKATTSDGMTPLHFVGEETSLEVVQFLIDRRRGLVDVRDKSNNLPLHYAAANGAPLPVIQLLVAHRPGSVSERGDGGKHPLHCAAAGSTPDVVEFLWGESPASIRETDDDGNLPLHSAVTFEEDDNYDDAIDEIVEFQTPVTTSDTQVNVVRRLLEKFPESVQRRNGKGRLPWQLALKAKYPGENEFAVLEALAEAWPESLLKADRAGRLMLHEVCSWRSGNAALVRLLVDLRGQAVRLRDRNGKTPLHCAVLAIAWGELLPVVDILLDAWVDGAAAQDAGGKLPLHCALKRSYVGLDLVELLVDRRPESVRVPDHRGRIPLHYAVEAGHAEAVALLMSKWHGSHRVRDGEGKCAMHVAFSSSSSLEVIELLLKEAPGSLDERDNHGRVPLHLAATHKCPDPHFPDAVRKLLDTGGHTLLVRDNEGQLPLHAAIARAEERETRAIEIVRLMIQHGPAARELRDNRGRLPLHVAVAKDVPVEPIVKDLVDLYPEALQVAAVAGSLPVHVALSTSACPPVDLIRLLVGPWPGSLQVAEGCGLYPLHLVLYKHNVNMAEYGIGNWNRLGDRVHRTLWPVVQYLVQLCPATTSLPDPSGRLPLHAAAALGDAAGPELLDLLVRASPPDACLHLDRDGRVPLHHAVLLAPRAVVSWPAVEALARARPESLQVRDNTGFTPVHLAAMRRATPATLYRLVRSSPPLLIG
jgi:ankyrin repeat protein